MEEQGPFPEKGKERNVGRQILEPEPEQKEPGNHDGTGPLPEKRKDRKVGRQAPEPEPEPGNHDGTRNRIPFLRKVGRQTPEPQPEPEGNRKS